MLAIFAELPNYFRVILWHNVGPLLLFHQYFWTTWLTSQNPTNVSLQRGLYCGQYTHVAVLLKLHDSYLFIRPVIYLSQYKDMWCFPVWGKTGPLGDRRCHQGLQMSWTLSSLLWHVSRFHEECFILMDLELWHSRWSALQLPGYHCVPLQILQGQHLWALFQLTRWVGSLGKGLSISIISSDASRTH